MENLLTHFFCVTMVNNKRCLNSSIFERTNQSSWGVRADYFLKRNARISPGGTENTLYIEEE